MAFVGQKIKIMDDILGEVKEGRIFFMEADNDVPGLMWLYLISDDDDENTIIEPKFDRPYWKLIPDSAEFIVED